MEDNVIRSAILEERRLESIIKNCIKKFPHGEERVISKIAKDYYQNYLEYISTKNYKGLRLIKKLFKIKNTYVPPQALKEKDYLTAIELERAIAEEVKNQLPDYRKGGMPIQPPAEVIELYPKKD